MSRAKSPWLYFALLLIVPIQLLWAKESFKTLEKASLIINAGNSAQNCSNALQNCVIQISQNLPQCLPKPGAITITNNSRIVANNIQASSADSNFINYVVQNNSCPAFLQPGQSCSISFFTNTSIAFLISNVLVKGTNTSSTFFNMQALACATPQAELSATPTTVNLITGGSSQNVTVTNIGNVNANNVQATLASSNLGIMLTNNCPSTLAPNTSCQFTFTPGSNAGSTTATIAGSNTINSVSIGITETIPQAKLSASPTTINLTYGGAAQSVAVTNIGNANANNVLATLNSPTLGIMVSSNCPSVLLPNGSCQITFTPGSSAGSTTATIAGSNTVNSVPIGITETIPPTTLSVTPSSFTTTIGQNQLVTVTNIGSASALNVTASPTSPLSIQSTTCGSSLSAGNSCQLTFSATGTTTQNVPINGDNTNTVSLSATVLGAVAGAPIHLTSTTGNGQATLTWSAPTNTGDSAITGYTVTPFIGSVGQTAVTVGSTVLTTTITGLTNGTTYTFTVAANNASGTGILAYSNFVTPSSGLVVNPSTLALSGLGGGAPRTITVTNTNLVPTTIGSISGPTPALPGSGSGAASITSNNCLTTLLPGASCTVTVDPGSAANTSANCTTGPTPSVLTFTPDIGSSVDANILILGYGCIYQSGYLFSIDDTTPTTASIGGIVAALSDQVSPSTGIYWSPGGIDTPIWGIGDRSIPSTAFYPSPNATSPYPAILVLGQANCDGPDDGFCNSSNMLTSFSTGNTYSAGICQGISDGGYLDWHLPAMCELGPFNPYSPSSLCTPGSTNMLDELFLQGIGGLVNNGTYWSSTEASDVAIFSWNRQFGSPSSQQLNGKNFTFGIRCARNLAN
ncbi:beta strand repeat-containing protein [Legionella steelei]|uniref:beta strand repeat-containing protein n=1 Tax=Legionella steelei TaxID=947033 RepID=UPI001AD1A08E|nr:fibronectin type III domain-containing protein [Legionella steelei]MBN9227048.1 fibronectin type III domain-containing protein [Legionella steelei]